MNEKINVGTPIQGVVFKEEGCYRIDESHIIIPQGKKLGMYINQMPYGKIDKKVPGIGATSLELKSDRNSIIVVPTKNLAYSKSIDPNKYKVFYVGSAIAGVIEKPSDEDIQEYIKSSDDKFKKLLVVADSLPRVIDCINTEKHNWFIMLDEIDCFQEQSNFRESLEIAIDHYLDFDKEQRCMVSATLKKFSKIELQDQNEKLLIFNYPEVLKRKIKIMSTDDVNDCCIHKIILLHDNLFTKNEKLLIAYNSVDDAKIIIDILPEPYKCNCKILCSENNKGKAGDYFDEINDKKLPSLINFITSAYFTGIDIDEEYHLVNVCTIRKPYTLLSMDKTYQIYGRSRISKVVNGLVLNGVLSETLIHDAYIKKREEYTSSIHYLVKKAETGLMVINSTKENLEGADFDYETIRKIQIMIKENLTYMGFPLLRVDYKGKIVVSHFNIDSIIEFQKTYNVLYSTQKSVIINYMKEGHIITPQHIYFYQLPVDPVIKIKKEHKGEMDAHIQRKKALENIANGKIHGMDNYHAYVKHEKKVHVFFNYLTFFIEPNVLINKLQEITKDTIGSVRLRNFEKSVKFVSLSNERLEKKVIMANFKVNHKYTIDEIFEIVNEINNSGSLKNFFGKIKTSTGAKMALSPYVNMEKKRDKKNNTYGWLVIDYNTFGVKIKDDVNDDWAEELPNLKSVYSTCY